MTYATTAAHPGFLARIYSAWADNKLEQYRRAQYTRTVRDLENLSDQRLRDIGVARADIMQTAYDSVYHKTPYAASDH